MGRLRDQRNKDLGIGVKPPAASAAGPADKGKETTGKGGESPTPLARPLRSAISTKNVSEKPAGDAPKPKAAPATAAGAPAPVVQPVASEAEKPEAASPPAGASGSGEFLGSGEVHIVDEGQPDAAASAAKPPPLPAAAAAPIQLPTLELEDGAAPADAGPSPPLPPPPSAALEVEEPSAAQAQLAVATPAPVPAVKTETRSGTASFLNRLDLSHLPGGYKLQFMRAVGMEKLEFYMVGNEPQPVELELSKDDAKKSTTLSLEGGKVSYVLTYKGKNDKTNAHEVDYEAKYEVAERASKGGFGALARKAGSGLLKYLPHSILAAAGAAIGVLGYMCDYLRDVLQKGFYPALIATVVVIEAFAVSSIVYRSKELKQPKE